MIAGMITVLALVIGVLLVVVAVMAQKNCCAKRELEEARDDVCQKLGIAEDKLSKREARISDLELAIRGKIKDIETLKADAQKRVAEVENALNLRNQEIEALKAKVAEHQAKYARYRCPDCGKIVSKKDFESFGGCEHCLNKESTPIPASEPITEIAPEQAKEYLTTQEAGEILKAGGEVILMYSDGAEGGVYYARPDGCVGAVHKSDNSRGGAYCPSVEKFAKEWGDQRWAIYKAPPTKEADGTA